MTTVKRAVIGGALFIGLSLAALKAPTEFADREKRKQFIQDYASRSLRDVMREQETLIGIKFHDTPEISAIPYLDEIPYAISGRSDLRHIGKYLCKSPGTILVSAFNMPETPDAAVTYLEGVLKRELGHHYTYGRAERFNLRLMACGRPGTSAEMLAEAIVLEGIAVYFESADYNN
jgi:hypothetical protein